MSRSPSLTIFVLAPLLWAVAAWNCPARAAILLGGVLDDSQTSIIYDADSGAFGIDAPLGVDLTSVEIGSDAGIFSGAVQNLGGGFDVFAAHKIFKATFGSSFGSLSFGFIAPTGLTETFVANDLAVVGSLSGGGNLGEVDLVYRGGVPEPASMAVIGLCCLAWGICRRMS